MTSQEAIEKLANGTRATCELITAVYADVAPLCTTDTDGMTTLYDWLWMRSYSGRETPGALAAEWDGDYE